MTEAKPRLAANSGSFRDPTGRVLQFDERVFRVISGKAIEDYRFVRDKGLLSRLSERGWLIASEEATLADFEIAGGAEEGSVLLEHPRVPFVSYPYEWPFRALQRAALLHLDLQIELLRDGTALSDATAYNIQFDGPEPVFIDLSSLRQYREGELWLGHRQFCEQFLNPLLLQASTGVSYHAWYRGSLEGVPVQDLARVLPWRAKANWRVFLHVVMQARLQASAGGRSTAELGEKGRKGLSRAAFEALLGQLRSWIRKLEPKGASRSNWADYEARHTYEAGEREQKLQFVAEFVQAVRPRLVWDLGCNAGEYSVRALQSGAERVIGFDYDLGALDAAYERARTQRLRFLPLFLDAANPSPNQGWRQRERAGLADRANADAVLALAFEHHLTIGRNVPLPDFVAWLVSLAPRGVVEFVEKTDPTVRTMLAMREDIFDSYGSAEFSAALSASARIVKRKEVSRSGRTLFWYEK